MKHGVWVGAGLAATIAFGGLARPADAAEGLNLRRVMLSTGGVGYFEYEATVQDTVDLSLSVRLGQVNDVLKSIIVYDSGGNLGEVSLPGKELLTEAFRDLPFSEEALESPAALLNALRGADVRVEYGGRVIEGRIVSVSEETSTLPGGGTVTRHRLTLLSAGALEQVIVEELQSLRVVDEALQRHIDAALRALARQRERERRELVIHIAGVGERVVRVGYVAEVPLWKTTYRLTLPREAGANTAALSGFAVVENRSGEAWNNIDLTLVSGNPVTFRQAIYETYYVHRPEVPVEVLGRVLPRPDEGGVRRRAAEGEAFARSAEMADMAPAAAPGAGLVEALASATEEATQVVFHLPGPVSIESGQSTLMPIIDASLPAERVSLYQPDVEKRHPISSVQLTNTGSVDLPPGALTVYERSAGEGFVTYVGDAQLSLTPVNASRFVSFAVDLRVTVDRAESTAESIAFGRIVDGTLQFTRTERRTTTYTIAGAAQEPRTVVLEHPRVPEFELADSQEFEVVEVTATHYRLRRQIAAGETVTLKVTLERPVVESVTLLDLPRERVPEPVRAALTRIAELQAAVADRQAARDALVAERTRIMEDQTRIRENLKAIPAGSDLAKRYLTQLEEEENRLQALRGEIDAAEAAIAGAQRALTEYIRGLQL
jgi:hypothetical protein